MNFLDLFVVVGGISSTLTVIFLTFVVPFADHAFTITALKTLFVIKQSSLPNLFPKIKDDFTQRKRLKYDNGQNIEGFEEINFTIIDNLSLFFT